MPDTEPNVGGTVEPAGRSVVHDYALRLYPLDQSEEVRLSELWRLLWGRRWLILAVAVAAAVAAYALSFAITPRYRATVVMVPVGAEKRGGIADLVGQFGGLASLAGINLTTGDSTAEALATLKSRSLTQRFIEQNDMLPELFADDWDAETGTWAVDDPAEAPTLWRGFDVFDKSVRGIAQDTETGLVSLTIDWKDPRLATSWANGIVAEVNAYLRNRAIEESKQNIEYLRTQLQDVGEVELRTALFGLMEAEMKNSMMSTVKSEYAFEVIDPAIVPEKSYWPNRLLLAALGLATGFLCAMLLVIARHSFRG